MQITVNLPVKVVVNDYHKFDDAQDTLRLLDRRIKVVEVGYAGEGYVGVAYIGNKNEPENKAMFDSVNHEVKEYYHED